MGICSFRHFGRFANFHYECACAYGYAKKHGLEFSVPNWTNNAMWNPIYLQHLVHPNYNRKEDVLLNETWDAEHHLNDYPFKEEWRDKNIVFNGFNQSYKYFDFCRDEMIKDWRYSYHFDAGKIAVHVRRGDYVRLPLLHPTVTIEYLNKAIALFLDMGYREFVFFSDDDTWCIQQCKSDSFIFSKDCNVHFASSANPVEDDLVAASSCEHIICSNSSLSLLMAELNKNPNKIVVVPSEANWFGSENKKSVKDMYRENWIQIKYKPIYEL